MAKYTVYPAGYPHAATMALPEAYAREVAGDSHVLVKDNAFWLDNYKKPREVVNAYDVYELQGYADHQRLFVDMYRLASGAKDVDFLISCVLAEVEHAEQRIAELRASPQTA
jgi:hypothetical protein